MPLGEYEIYEDAQISDKEKTFIKDLITYIDKLLDGVYADEKYNINLLNQNIELIDRLLWQDYKI